MMSPIVLMIEKPNYLDKAGLHILISFVFSMIFVATADYVTNFKASVNLSVVLYGYSSYRLSIYMKSVTFNLLRGFKSTTVTYVFGFFIFRSNSLIYFF